MPILSNGLLVGMCRSRAMIHLGKLITERKTSPEPHDVHALIDIVYFNGDKLPPENRLDFRYSGYTLRDVFDGEVDWPERSRRQFLNWLNQPGGTTFIRKTARLWLQNRNATLFQYLYPKPMFYYALSQRLATCPQYSAKPRQWANMIRNLVNKGISKTEIEYSGILPWLEAKPDAALTREEVARAARPLMPKLWVGHEVQINQYKLRFRECCHLLRSHKINYHGLRPRYSVVRYSTHNNHYRIVLNQYRNGKRWFYNYLLLIQPQPALPSSLKNNFLFFNNMWDALNAAQMIEKRRYKTCTEISRAGYYAEHTFPGGHNYREWLFTASEISNEYYGEHFDTPNVIFHARTTDRNCLENRRILMIEEIQSDFFQSGALTELTPNNARNLQIFANIWPQLVIKCLIGLAIQENYDGIAWTTGQQQQERYLQYDTPGLKCFYDKTIYDYFHRLARCWHLYIETITVLSRQRNLRLFFNREEKCCYVVTPWLERLTKNFRHKAMAESLIEKHSQPIKVAVPALIFNETMRHDVTDRGLPVFGLPTNNSPKDQTHPRP